MPDAGGLAKGLIDSYWKSVVGAIKKPEGGLTPMPEVRKLSGDPASMPVGALGMVKMPKITPEMWPQAASEAYDTLLSELTSAIESKGLIRGLKGSAQNQAEHLISMGLHKAFDESGLRVPVTPKIQENISLAEELLGPEKFDRLVGIYSMLFKRPR